jgi:hypothetical protein
MKAAEYNTILDKLATEYLKPVGFVSSKNNWFYSNENYKLAFLAMNGGHPMMQIKAFTLALVHNDIPNIDKKIVEEKDSDLWSYPIFIAPTLLKAHLTGGLSDEIWKYKHRYEDNSMQDKCFNSIYYGGPDKNTLADKNASKKEKKQSLKDVMLIYGVDNIEEANAIEELKQIVQNVANYAIDWGNAMTMNEVIHQLENYGQNRPFEVTWIENYKNKLKQ